VSFRPTRTPRRIVSLVPHDGSAVALADDGTIWRLNSVAGGGTTWTQLPGLPERTEGHDGLPL
jgi:hypothetical protein